MQGFVESFVESVVEVILFVHAGTNEVIFHVMTSPLSPLPEPLLKRIIFTEDADCAICLAHHDRSASELPCGHSFHPACIAQWIQIKRTCPICRHDATA
jgi:hypothetical protein